MLRGIPAAAQHVFEAAVGGDGLGRLEARAGVGDEADAGEDLIGLDHDLVGAVDALDARRTIAERRIDAGLPQIGRFEDVRVGRENQGGTDISSHLIRRQLWQRAPRRQGGRGRVVVQIVFACVVVP